MPQNDNAELDAALAALAAADFGEQAKIIEAAINGNANPLIAPLAVPAQQIDPALRADLDAKLSIARDAWGDFYAAFVALGD